MSRSPRVLNASLTAVVFVCMSGSIVLTNERLVDAHPIAQLIADHAQSDEQVRYNVEERLRTDGRIDWEVLDVDVQRGQVTLYGEVLTEDQKGLASLIASTVPGSAGIGQQHHRRYGNLGELSSTESCVERLAECGCVTRTHADITSPGRKCSGHAGGVG